MISAYFEVMNDAAHITMRPSAILLVGPAINRILSFMFQCELAVAHSLSGATRLAGRGPRAGNWDIAKHQHTMAAASCQWMI